MPALTLNDPRVIAYLEQLAAAGFLDKAVFTAIGEELLLSTDDRFKNQTDPEGRPWASLNAEYAAWKRKFHGHDRILKLRGYLRDTLRYQATDASVAIGSNRIYSAIHQFGGQAEATRPLFRHAPTLASLTTTSPPSLRLSRTLSPRDNRNPSKTRFPPLQAISRPLARLNHRNAREGI